jgi:hypothetical protein
MAALVYSPLAINAEEVGIRLEAAKSVAVVPDFRESPYYETNLESTGTVVLDFEGIGDQIAVQEFYNGGTDGVGHQGPNYGISFGGNALGIIDVDAGGTGNFANEPSPSTVLFFLSGSGVFMNVPNGFYTGFSFYYSSNGQASVSVHDGLNGTGNLLATLNLNANFNQNCTGDPNGAYCHWDRIGVNFNGTARSVNFGGTANYVGFDNITLDETPTLVTLIDFTATKLDGSVLIEWQTDTEIDNAGFHLWRSEEEEGEYIRITNSMIPAQGSGSQYSYLDEDAIDDITYYYKLEDIDLYGVSTFHGPISSTAYILITPAEGAVLPIRTPATFEWVDSEDIEGYKLQFSNQSDFSGKVVTRPKNQRKWITSNVYTPTEQKWRAIKRLGKKGLTIFWRVLGKIEDETVIYSETGSLTLEKTQF